VVRSLLVGKMVERSHTETERQNEKVGGVKQWNQLESRREREKRDETGKNR
jgi:hypothetical protein